MPKPQEKPSLGHVIIVEDDETFRGALANALRQEGFKVTAVGLAKQAQDIIGLEDVGIVVSDINLPGISGIQLLHFVKGIKPNLPVILMTGFAELKETQEAYEMGARGFLAKPFKKEELLVVIRKWLGIKTGEPEPDEENRDLDYCKLNIEEFISGKEIKYDIFVRLSEKKYIKIAHQGEDIPLERIDSYKAKNIKHLYMRKDDFRRYLDFNLTLLPAVQITNKIPKEKKRAFLKHTSEVILENLHLNGVDEEGFQSAKTVVESAVSLLSEPDEMMSLLTMLNTHSDFLYAHSLGVSMYGVMIAKAMGWHSPANIFKVAMGGLLHDIGKKEIDRKILEKTRLEMTAEDIKAYESHPYRGAEILREVSTVPTDVLQIVIQHHEDCMGLGFPMGISKNHIHPMARLISVSNVFCGYTIRNPSGKVLLPHEAISRMMAHDTGKLDPQFVEALHKLFRPPSAQK